MVFYAGGNSVNPTASGYSFWLNSWSDLGRTVAWSGKNNMLSQLFFSLAMVVWGISYAPSIYALASLFTESPRGKLYCKLGTICAVICVASLFIEVVFFPADLHPDPHLILAAIGYLFLLLVLILFALVMVWDKNYPTIHAMFFLAPAVCIVLYGVFAAPILQKSVSVTLILVTFIVFYDALKRTR